MVDTAVAGEDTTVGTMEDTEVITGGITGGITAVIIHTGGITEAIIHFIGVGELGSGVGPMQLGLMHPMAVRLT